VLLIKAALLKDIEARAAWEQWRLSHDIDLVGPESYSLLPQVYKNLQAQSGEERLFKKLKGIYRHTWCKNRLFVGALVPLLRSLENAGVSTLTLNSTMMSAAFTGDFGLYPLEKAEIVIPREGIVETIKCLQRLGWSSWATAPETELRQKGTLSWKNLRGHHCVIRWHVLETYVQPTAEQYFWCHVAEMPWEESKVYVLTPTAHLLKLLVDGAGHAGGITPRWVTEVFRTISLYGSNIAWDELFDLGKSLSLTFPLKHHLKNVVSIVNPGLSLVLLQNIEDLPSTKMEALEYRAKFKRTSGNEGLLSRLSVHWCQYVRIEGQGNIVKRVVGFAGYLNKIWNVNHILQLPIYGIFRSVRRIYREGLV
jgi:hypothetical protein